MCVSAQLRDWLCSCVHISSEKVIVTTLAMEIILWVELGCYLLGKGEYVSGSIGFSVWLFVCLWTTLLKKL